MFNSKLVDEHLYTALMNQMKFMNKEYLSIRRSGEYKIGKAISVTFRSIKSLDFRQLKKTIHNRGMVRKIQKLETIHSTASLCRVPNYFSNEKIVVYTAIFGRYDKLLEPICHPDNVDYFIVTDQEIDLTNSTWKKRDYSALIDKLSGLSSSEKNRYVKMHPQELFNEYNYSIYIDGNIQVITDLTEYIYDVGEYGLAAHLHSSRDCVYDECKAVVRMGKESRKNIEAHIKHLTEEGFPHHYGLLECNVLVRRHCEMCSKIMDEWWSEFCNYSKRDQISLPFVLYKNKISIHEIGTLGNNVYENFSFRVIAHL